MGICLGGTRTEPLDWYHISTDGQATRVVGRICARDQKRTDPRACWGCAAYRGADWNGERRQTGVAPDGTFEALSWGEYPEWQSLQHVLLTALDEADYDTDAPAVQDAQIALDQLAYRIGSPSQEPHGLRFRAFVELDADAARDYYLRYRAQTLAWRAANPHKVRRQQAAYKQRWRQKNPDRAAAAREREAIARRRRQEADPEGWRERERIRKQAWRKRASVVVNGPPHATSSIGVAAIRSTDQPEHHPLTRVRVDSTVGGSIQDRGTG